jgi:hypothetical protein
MTVYCVKDERGWLFREGEVGDLGAPGERAEALMVYLDPADARADTESKDISNVVEVNAAAITRALEEGHVRYVRIRLGDGGSDQLCALAGWRTLVACGVAD